MNTERKILAANARWASLMHTDPKSLTTADLIAMSDDIALMRRAMQRVANYLTIDEDNHAYREHLGEDECKVNGEMRKRLLEALAI